MITLRTLIILTISIIMLSACGDDTPDFNVPEDYSFMRDGISTVSYDGQTTRIKMAEELSARMKDPSTAYFTMLDLFENQDRDGNDIDPFTDESLNASSKSIRSKTAASTDFFASNTVEAAEVKQQFDDWMSKQVSETNIFFNKLATAGNAGQIADGSSTRYVNAKGLEYNQVVSKSLIGALMADQILNNYLSPAVLDAGENRENNTAGITEDSKSYTTMEHKWDEAYGYLFGLAANASNPMSTFGEDDNFLNEYVGKVAADSDFPNLGSSIFEAYKTGRAAIVAGDYDERDKAADILKEQISKAIAIRTVYYLESGATELEANEKGGAFHSLSEAYGFIYSLRFTRKAGSADPYFSASEVESYLIKLYDYEQGFWDVPTSAISEISESISAKFDFTVAQAATTE